MAEEEAAEEVAVVVGEQALRGEVARLELGGAQCLEEGDEEAMRWWIWLAWGGPGKG